MLRLYFTVYPSSLHNTYPISWLVFLLQGLSHLETLQSVATEMSSVSPGEMSSVSPGEMSSVSPGGLRQPLTSVRASPGLSPLKRLDKQNGEDIEDMDEREESEDKEGRESRGGISQSVHSGGMTASQSGNTNMTSVQRSGNRKTCHGLLQLVFCSFWVP